MALDKQTMVGLLNQIAIYADAEAPSFMVMNIRDWWTLRRGGKWRHPLPPRKTLKDRRRPRFKTLRRVVWEKHRGVQ